VHDNLAKLDASQALGVREQRLDDRPAHALVGDHVCREVKHGLVEARDPRRDVEVRKRAQVAIERRACSI
jgi:hypothetical protein